MKETFQTVRDSLSEEDVVLFEDCYRMFQHALRNEYSLANLKLAVDQLADASAPFGRIRFRLNEAVGREMSERGVNDHVRVVGEPD